MHTDALDLREFYDSPMGHVARRMIRRRLRDLWPNVSGQTILGLGYPTPYLRPFRDEAGRVLAFMPAAQGAMFWPGEGPGLVALTDEAELPLPDLSVDRVVVVHGIEGTQNLRPMMREIWRVLAGGGRLITVVPNRRGLWARADWTPFGHGFPYSQSQLKSMLREHLFVPERTSCALFIPPLQSRFGLSWAPAWEEIGYRWFKAFAGVAIVESSKQILAGIARRARPAAPQTVIPVADGPEPVHSRTLDRDIVAG